MAWRPAVETRKPTVHDTQRTTQTATTCLNRQLADLITTNTGGANTNTITGNGTLPNPENNNPPETGGGNDHIEKTIEHITTSDPAANLTPPGNPLSSPSPRPRLRSRRLEARTLR